MGLQRQSGVALWRQIADEIRSGLAVGLADADGRLPSESALAAHFNANRHTVRAALSALAREGVVEARRGLGTFALRQSRFAYPIATRTRFSDALRDQGVITSTIVKGSQRETASALQCRKLNLPVDADVVRLHTVSFADGQPLTVATHWFDAQRFPLIDQQVARSQSITSAFQTFGITDYVRVETVIEARHAADAELTDLKLAPGAIVLVAEAVNADMDGMPIQFSQTRFSADRVSLVIPGAEGFT